MFEKIFGNYQNVTMPQQQDSSMGNNYFGQNFNNSPPPQYTPLPQPMNGALTDDKLYPFQSPNSGNVPNYAEGGEVKKSSKKEKNNPYPSLAELIRKQGKGEDMILAHINPLEAMMLKEMGGSGTINPTTGLPQFGMFNKPWKAIKSVLGGAGGSILGNMILPGIGGIIGGALGQGTQNAMRGKSFGQGALKGGLTGALLPSAAGLAGSGANALGMNQAGNFLNNYGTNNSILNAIGMGTTGVSAGEGNGAILPGVSNFMDSGGKYSNQTLNQDLPWKMAPKNALSNRGPQSYGMNDQGGSWLSKWAEPANLLTGLSVAGSFMNRPKKETPERRGRNLALEKKAFDKTMLLSGEERAAQEANMLAEEQMKRRIQRNKYLPEERFEVNPLLMKKGGKVPPMMITEEDIETPPGLGVYIQGCSKGQDDEVNAKVSHGEFVIPADVVSDIGDGNNEAGANELYTMMKNVRIHKGKKNKLPPKAKSLASYMMR